MRDRVAPHRSTAPGGFHGPLPHLRDGGGAARSRPWWVHGLAGLAGIVLGAVVLAYPSPSVKLLGVLVGIDLLLFAIALIVRGTDHRDNDPASGPAGVLLGTLALIGGLATIRNPGGSIALIVLALAAFLIADGALALARGLLHREGRWTALLRGALFVALGTVIVSWPDLSVTTLAVLSGIALILQGVVEIAGALLLRAVPATPPGP